MRKKHQSIHISTLAKKSLCSEINLGDYTSDMEIKDHLTNYFNDNIKDEDVPDDDPNISSDDDSFEICKMKVPQHVVNTDKEFAKFQISERAVLTNIEDFNYEFIPKNKINIGENENENENESEQNEENNIDMCSNIELEDIIKQFIFWKENSEQTDNKDDKSDIDPFLLFNLNEEKIKTIKDKIDELKKIVKEKNMNEPMLNQLLNEIENKYIEQRQELNNLANNIDKVDNISYGKDWSFVEYKQ